MREDGWVVGFSRAFSRACSKKLGKRDWLGLTWQPSPRWTLQIRPNVDRSKSAKGAGDFRGVERHMRRVTAGCEGDRRLQWLGPAGFAAANARSWLLMALAATGRFDEGIAEGRTGPGSQRSWRIHTLRFRWPGP
jgi:hypothetical protein